MMGARKCHPLIARSAPDCFPAAQVGGGLATASKHHLELSSNHTPLLGFFLANDLCHTGFTKKAYLGLSPNVALHFLRIFIFLLHHHHRLGGQRRPTQPVACCSFAASRPSMAIGEDEEQNEPENKKPTYMDSWRRDGLSAVRPSKISTPRAKSTACSRVPPVALSVADRLAGRACFGFECRRESQACGLWPVVCVCKDELRITMSPGGLVLCLRHRGSGAKRVVKGCC